MAGGFPRVKRTLLSAVIVLVVVLLVAITRTPSPSGPPAPEPPPPTAQSLPAAATPVSASPADATAAVRRVHALIGAFLVAVKEPYRPPLGDNRDAVRALTGGNRYGDVFLASNDPALNARGEWIDPWGRPYHLHARAAGVIDVRSAGPDGILFTADDLTAP